MNRVQQWNIIRCIAIVAENIKNYPGVKDGKEYLLQLRETLEESQFKYDYLDKEFSKEVINRFDFYRMNAEIYYMGHNIKQAYYTTILKGFSLSIIITFINEEQKEVLLSSLKSIQNRN